MREEKKANKTEIERQMKNECILWNLSRFVKMRVNGNSYMCQLDLNDLYVSAFFCCFIVVVAVIQINTDKTETRVLFYRVVRVCYNNINERPKHNNLFIHIKFSSSSAKRRRGRKRERDRDRKYI